jgi:hypothetical protein
MLGMGLIKSLRSLALREVCGASKSSRPGIGHDVALGWSGRRVDNDCKAPDNMQRASASLQTNGSDEGSKVEWR